VESRRNPDYPSRKVPIPISCRETGTPPGMGPSALSGQSCTAATILSQVNATEQRPPFAGGEVREPVLAQRGPFTLRHSDSRVT